MKRIKNQSKTVKWLCVAIVLLIVVICVEIGIFLWRKLENRQTPEDVVEEYFTLLESKEYAKMYELLDEESVMKITDQKFITRNKNIYEGIEMSDIKIEIPEKHRSSRDKVKTVTYNTSLKTFAGEIAFDNQMVVRKNEEGKYKIVWEQGIIFPDLTRDDKVRIDTQPAERGNIYDRNGNVLAAQGTISEVGLVPGKMGGDKEVYMPRIAELLDMTVEEINEKLGESWVKDDMYVPMRQIANDDSERIQHLLNLPGVMINEVVGRVYPMGETAGHVTGYVQAITAEELEKYKDEGYHSGSIIGKTGIERAFEKELRAQDGYTINIVDANGNVKEVLAVKEPQNGKDVYLTIDSTMQQTAYEQFSGEQGAVAAMNPKTGEILALVSTPGYDSNELVMGVTESRWNELNEGEGNPMMNRFSASWVPGSTFKAITAAIGVNEGIIEPDENLGNVGLSWQKDASWGNYYVTTLVDYGEIVNLENALVYSDNIYFARQSLAIGADTLQQKFQEMGFDEKLPLELGVQKSTYDDNGEMDSDIQIADTGYGQGELLVNPVHLLSMYSMFVNDGNMIQPTLVYEEGKSGTLWKKQIISAETAEIVKNDLIQTIENPNGTGANARIEGLSMLGKTGTAEVKNSQEDQNGVERGWFICETVEDIEKPVAVVGMIEDVKNKGGSHYVAEKVRNVIAAYEGK